MTEAITATSERPQLGIRTGSSRKLLARKALEKAERGAMDGEALEASFPGTGDVPEAEVAPDCVIEPAVEAIKSPMLAPDLPATAAKAPPAPALTAAAPAPAPTPAWSAKDESALQPLLARRKAAGYQRRGRDVSGQLIAAGSIRPNPDTVVAVIVGIVAERGSIKRGELIDAMAVATFPHAKAQPADKGWCQGYVAGALRNGFLSLAEQPVAAEAA